MVMIHVQCFIAITTLPRLTTGRPTSAYGYLASVRSFVLVLCLADYASAVRKASPFIIIAQMMRAILLASATAASFGDLRLRSSAS